MKTRLGQKRERPVIQSFTTTVSDGGEPLETWSTFATVWARAEFLSGRELESMQKINTAIALKFTVDYRTNITELMRVSWRSETWNIEAILPDERKDDMAILVSKVE